MISFSGIDCGGKSTQIEMISEYMNSTSKYRNRVKIIHSRGGYTPVLEFAKKIVRTDRNAAPDRTNTARQSIQALEKENFFSGYQYLIWGFITASISGFVRYLGK